MNLNLPASIAYPVALFAGLAVVLHYCKPVEPATPADDGRAVLLAESLATARAEARYALEQWEIALQDHDTVVKRVVRYIQRHDTAWQDTGSIDTVEVVRWLAVSDSTLRVVRDSLEGELVQCRFDAQTCADASAARPSGYWRGFRDGAFLTGATMAGACWGI